MARYVHGVGRGGKISAGNLLYGESPRPPRGHLDRKRARFMAKEAVKDGRCEIAVSEAGIVLMVEPDPEYPEKLLCLSAIGPRGGIRRRGALPNHDRRELRRSLLEGKAYRFQTFESQIISLSRANNGKMALSLSGPGGGRQEKFELGLRERILLADALKYLI